MMALWIALGVLAAVLLVCLAAYLVSVRMFQTTFRCAVREGEHEDSMLEHLKNGRFADKLPLLTEGVRMLRELPYEEVYVTSYDGLRLYGRLYLSSASCERTVVMAHGYQSTPGHDFCGAMPFYFAQNCNVLVIHQRAHGNSEGEYICFGAKERYDMRDWCRYLVQRFGERHEIMLVGISMGATTVLLAACLPDLPQNVIGVVADCGFTSPKEEFTHVMKHHMHLLPFPILWLAERICMHRAGFAFDDADTVRALTACRCPVLFVHGGADSFVPVEHTLQNYAACGNRKELLVVPGAEHGLSFLVDEAKYRKAATAFFQSVS